MKSSKYFNIIISMLFVPAQACNAYLLRDSFFYLHCIGIGKISFIMKSKYNYINNNGSKIAAHILMK